MWDTVPPIRLIRYLLVLRVNSVLVRVPRCLPLALSLVLGTLIAERLPTHEARHWRKALAPWRALDAETTDMSTDDMPDPASLQSAEIPDISWPLDVVWHVYPGKQMYGRGEPILVELKMLGGSAEHELFLGLMLPVLEEAGRTSSAEWRRSNALWGSYDLDAVYVARGQRWEPLAQGGLLDLDYRPTPLQWMEGMLFGGEPEQRLRQLTWLSPFAFSAPTEAPAGRPRTSGKPRVKVPNLRTILEATEVRLCRLLPGRRGGAGGMAELFADATPTWPELLEQADAVSIQRYQLGSVPKQWPGEGIGWQRFNMVPPAVVPYLNLAAIFHVGHYTHFGCGTFDLT